MQNETTLYDRYMNNTKGEKESINSHKTFIKFYLPTNPSPTYKELARLSGYKEGTCQQWISINEYKKRKKAIQEYEQQQKQKKEQEIKDNFLSEILVIEAKSLKKESQLQNAWLIKEGHELEANSTSMKTPYDLVDVESNKFNKLRQLRKDNVNDHNKLLDNYDKFKDLHEYDKTININKDAMDELSERAEEIRFYDNAERSQEIKEALKNDEY
ncbi:hypothetical protein PXD04_10340 [Methanosphaera sp. ISO3-F5]|uniref:hypothetical protein n=1 Tax=Methanosphaera sp. ISO3-F5 TaxID=1452353 RepID=UPI002B257627|nr:hypothetical protein [Methanosphaera sp. ISO3-F5]WQH64089.1 hypothetical protein PXD04_10340 [Methanosphaera sp. ISO3-F5]